MPEADRTGNLGQKRKVMGCGMFAFVDESGYPRSTDSTLRPTLATVCIRPQDLRDITREIYQMKERLWGPGGPELHGTRFIRPRTLNDRTKKNTIDRAFSIMNGYTQLRVFAVVMERPSLPVPEASGRVGYHYFHVMRRIHLYADQLYHRESQATALILFDERDAKQDQQLSEAILNLLYGTHQRGLLNRILEMPVFVDSTINPGIQLADLVASVLRRYYEAGLDHRDPASSFEEWISTLHSNIRQRTQDFPRSETGGGTTYGIYTMSDRTLQEHAARVASQGDPL